MHDTTASFKRVSETTFYGIIFGKMFKYAWYCDYWVSLTCTCACMWVNGNVIGDGTFLTTGTDWNSGTCSGLAVEGLSGKHKTLIHSRNVMVYIDTMERNRYCTVNTSVSYPSPRSCLSNISQSCVACLREGRTRVVRSVGTMQQGPLSWLMHQETYRYNLLSWLCLSNVSCMQAQCAC